MAIRCRAAFLSVLFVEALSAQGLYVGPQPDAQPTVAPGTAPATVPVTVALPAAQPAPVDEPAVLAVVRTGVRATIVDGAASTEIEQTFHNGWPRAMEATWLLPLPAGAMADGFTMTVGDRQLAGEVLDGRTARAVYEQIVRQRRDPGLLEYAGEGLLRARVFPIPPHGDVTVKVRFCQLLQPTGGLYEWSWPLRVAQLTGAGASAVGIDLTIRSQTPIKTVLATLPNVDIVRKGEHEARIGLEVGRGAPPPADLRVLYGLGEQDFGLHLLPYRRAGEDGWFALMLAPKREWDQRPRQCTQFVLDTSGSMQGKKLLQAQAALRTFMRSLRPDDWFNVVTFATVARQFFPRPRLADGNAVAEALAGIDALQAGGGTNIGEALETVLTAELPASDGAETVVPMTVFVTDGAPTIGVTDVEQLLAAARQQNRRQMRLFVFGVGNDVNTNLLDRLAADHRGARDYVREDEDLEVKTAGLFTKLAEPALTDVEVRCEELEGFDVFPRRTRDLFAGETLQLVGRYRGDGPKTVRVTGKIGGAVREFAFPVEFPAQSTRLDFVPGLWAEKKVLALLDAIRLNGAQRELVDEVTQLSRTYGIATRTRRT